MSRRIMEAVSKLLGMSAAPASGSESSSATAVASEAKPKCKICCACPDTKKLRDECIVQNGEELCVDKIEAHKICLRKEGFNV